MENHKKIYLAVFLILAIGLQKAYSQTKWEVVVDTIKIEEVKVVDSSIITMLDSAFTFLRFPPLEFGNYYYSLTLENKAEPTHKSIFETHLYVEDYLISDPESLDTFNENYKFLLNYKGIQILVRSFRKSSDASSLQYFFKRTGKSGNFYHYHKVDKSRPQIVYMPNKQYLQSVQFLVRKGYIKFQGYTLDIDENM